MKVLGINMYNKTIQDAVNEILNSQREVASNKCISATGAHGLIFATRNKFFRTLLNSFHINLPDGMPASWVGRLKGAKNMRRCYGPEFFEKLMLESADKPIKHYLCGGMEGVADQLKTACEQKFRNYNVVGTFCPPFKHVDDYDYKNIAEEINASGADVVWIGLSTPKQEQFAYHLSQFTQVRYIATVGAAFDFHIGAVRQAPRWIQNIGMEWFFRLFMEPKRLWKRYLEIVPLFIYYSFADLLKGRF